MDPRAAGAEKILLRCPAAASQRPTRAATKARRSARARRSVSRQLNVAPLKPILLPALLITLAIYFKILKDFGTILNNQSGRAKVDRL